MQKVWGSHPAVIGSLDVLHNSHRSCLLSTDASSYLKSNRLFCTSSVKFIAGVFGGLFTLAVAYYKSRFKDNSIYSALMNGTNTVDTAVQSTEVVIKRTKEQQKIRNLIETDDALFGVIVGPTGTGKTHLTRLACCEPHTPGILYHEIGDASSFPQELANTIGMRLKSSFNVLDLLIWNVISEQYVSYHTLAADPEEATHYVLDKLAETSKRVKKKGHVPCLVIDGVDMLAKKNEDLFVKLVDQAKLYANAKKLYLVLVSSEGHIMPLIDKTSSRTRMAKVIQILDIDDGDAIKYLTERGVPQKASKHVVKHVGGRFVHLKKAVEMKRLHPTLDENDLFDQITSELYRLYVRPGRMAINYHHDKAKVIIKRLLDEPETSDPSLASQPYPKIDPQELCAGLKGKDLEEMDAAKTCLVNENLLRYDADGNLTWHSRLVHGALAKEFCSGPKRV